MLVALLVGGAEPSAAWAQKPTGAEEASAQATAPDREEPARYESAWRPLLELEGVRFSFIFYPYADNHHGGVVVRLVNDNDHPVRYRFTMVFRDGDENEREAVAEGRLAPGQMQTGDHDGLFWIPFTDGRSIGQVGMRHYRVRRVPPDA